jgi:hypothetical protein
MEREAMRLRQLWATIFREFNTPTPSLTQMYVWLSRYPAAVVEQGIHSTLRKAFYIQQHDETMRFAYQLNYCGKVLKMVTQQQVERELGRPVTPPAPAKLGKPAINPFTHQPMINPTTGKPVYKEER